MDLAESQRPGRVTRKREGATKNLRAATTETEGSELPLLGLRLPPPFSAMGLTERRKAREGQQRGAADQDEIRLQ